MIPIRTPDLLIPLALAVALGAAACQPATNTEAPVAAPATPVATQPATPPAPPADTATGEVFHWQCDEVGVASTYVDNAKRVVLAFSGRGLELPIAISASGARYADAAGNEFWTKGDSGTLVLAEAAEGENARRECSQTGRPSPWYLAAERGVGFRAGGGEPGWFVEVDRGDAPALRATLDYGERNIEVAQMQPTGADAPGFTGTAADGTPVVLEIDRTRCHDGMSGEAFEAAATLTVSDRSYQGCGAFLFE